jgi:hypothetical protein
MATTTDIRPDLTGDVPRCSTECPSYDRYETRVGKTRCMMPECGVIRSGQICFPAVRQLVQLSQRRCDGCRHWDPRAEWCVHPSTDDDFGWKAHESCSRWEAK